ncbi:MAG: hypothetical protein JF603_09245, partial [Acidobacteria bacterium]|nr:hypothetical protein [Acidobacteriota bacterium]
AAHVRAATEAVSPADRREALVAAATASCRAYRTDPEPLLDWWLARLPT